MYSPAHLILPDPGKRRGRSMSQTVSATASETPRRQPDSGTFMRILTLLAIVLSMIALTACAGAGDTSQQSRRNQAGPYLSGGGGIGF
jgi:hypothetical protein